MLNECDVDAGAGTGVVGDDANVDAGAAMCCDVECGNADAGVIIDCDGTSDGCCVTACGVCVTVYKHG